MNTARDISARLKFITTHEGWQDVLNIWEAEIVKAEFRLLNVPPGSSEQLMRDLLAHAKSCRSIFEQLQIRIQYAIEEGEAIVDDESVDPFGNFNL